MGSSTSLTVAQVRNVRRQPVDILEVVAVDPLAIQRVVGRSMFRSPEAARLWSTLLRAARRRGRGTELFACRARPLVGNEANRRLATIPGVGPITAPAIVAIITDPFQFHSARHLAAWIGLCPDSTAAAANSAKGGISKQGDRYLRRSLVLGATAVIRHSRSKSTAEAGWLKSLLERRPARLVSVAQANKTARIVWVCSCVEKPIACRQQSPVAPPEAEGTPISGCHS